MGSAIIARSLDQRTIQPTDVLAIDPLDTNRHAAQALGCATARDVAEAADAVHDIERRSGPALVLLATKPQALEVVAPALHAKPRWLRPHDHLVVSILAGIPTHAIAQTLQPAADKGPAIRVVRAMPNTPARIGAGVTALAPGALATADDIHRASALFRAVGHVELLDEHAFDAFTALVGSGPAYVFYLAQALEHAAHAMGFDPGRSRSLVLRTLVGSASLWQSQPTHDPAQLRASVTSKGGTTEAAIAVLDAHRACDALVQAVLAARDRAKALGASASLSHAHHPPDAPR